MTAAGNVSDASACTAGVGKSALTLPVIRPVATVFTAEDGRHLYAYKRAVYLEQDGRFAEYPCRQVYPENGETVYETEGGMVRVRTEGGRAYAKVTVADMSGGEAAEAVVSGGAVAEAVVSGGAADGCRNVSAEGAGMLQAGQKDHLPEFTGGAKLPDRFFYAGASEEIPLPETPWAHMPDTDVKNLPRKNLPCIVNIHGFGGNHHQYETNTEMFLERGFEGAIVV